MTVWTSPNFEDGTAMILAKISAYTTNHVIIIIINNLLTATLTGKGPCTHYKNIEIINYGTTIYCIHINVWFSGITSQFKYTSHLLVF